MVDRFDRVRAQIEGLPGYRRTRPTTITSTMPLVGDSVTYVIESVRDQDGEIMAFLQILDTEGGMRLVLPGKVVNAVVAQHERLFDRSTPDSRARSKRQRELVAKRTADHERGKHDPATRIAKGLPAAMAGCPLCVGPARLRKAS